MELTHLFAATTPDAAAVVVAASAVAALLAVAAAAAAAVSPLPVCLPPFSPRVFCAAEVREISTTWQSVSVQSLAFNEFIRCPPQSRSQALSPSQLKPSHAQSESPRSAVLSHAIYTTS